MVPIKSDEESGVKRGDEVKESQDVGPLVKTGPEVRGILIEELLESVFSVESSWSRTLVNNKEDVIRDQT